MTSKTSWFSPGAKQVWVSLAPLVTKVGAGMAYGFGSSILVYLQSPEPTIKMNMDMISWFVSSLMFAGILGNIIAGYLIDRYGRRPACIVCNIPASIGGITIYFANNVPTLIIGRMLFGLTVGANVVIGTVIIAEYCSPHNRGTLFNIKTAAYNMGCIVSHFIGHYVDWRTLSLISAAPYLVCCIIIYTAPESPSWLAANKQHEKSKTAFYWLRGRTEDSTREIEELIQSQKEKRTNLSMIQKVVDFISKFKRKNFLMPTLILVIAFSLLETSGRHILPSYGSKIIKDITSGETNMFYYKMLLDTVVLIACLISSYMIRIYNYRTILFFSGFSTFIVLNVGCLLIYLLSTGVVSSDYYLIPIIMFALYFFLGNLGCSCIPFALIGELYPLEHRAVGTALAGNVLLLTISVNLKIFPGMVAAFQIYGSFAIYGVAMLVSLGILYFILPETKDRTLLEIEEYFNTGSFRGILVATEDDDHSDLSREKMKGVC